MTKRRGKNEGSIRQRKDGLWEGALTIGLTEKGNPKRRSVYGKTRAEAAKKLNALLTQHHSGLLAEPSKMTVAECLERWITNKTNIDDGTRQKYRYEVKALMGKIGHLKLQGLRTLHVRDAYTALQSLSVRAQRKAALHLRAALREAFHDGAIAKNFAEGVKVSAPRVEKVAQVWTTEEVSTFLKVAESDPLYSLFYVMLTLGLRRGEALGLSWKHVNFTQGSVSIKQSLVANVKDGSVKLKKVKTPSSRCTLYLPQDVLTLLKVHKDRQAEQKQYLGEAWTDNGLVFTTSIGTPIYPGNALRSLRRLCDDAEVTKIRLHDLRHTYASLALQRGTPVELVSERLGHARVDITLNTYRHLYDAERQSAALSLTDLLGTQPRSVN